MLTVDINCDLGESFGAYRLGMDEDILPWITSANIACGFHAGDPSIMRKTVRLCLEHQVAIGAHPGLPDLIGFGRRNIAVSSEEVYDLVVYQIGALDAFVRSEGGQLHHVKPHGALYNMAAKDQALSRSIAEAVYKVNPELILYGLSGSLMIVEGEAIGLRCASEAFIDRTYMHDGSLTPRTEVNAVITDLSQATKQALDLVKYQSVTTITGETIKVKTDTICIHGDTPSALTYAQHIHNALKQEGVQLQPIA